MWRGSPLLIRLFRRPKAAKAVPCRETDSPRFVESADSFVQAWTGAANLEGTQNPPCASMCGFKSRPRHQNFSELHTLQPERVGDHRHRAHTHRGARYDRAQQQAEYGIERARSDRYPNYVVDEREEQILADV